MSPLTLALCVVLAELILIGAAALLLGDRLRKLLFSRRPRRRALPNPEAVAAAAEQAEAEAQAPLNVARALVILHTRLAKPFEPATPEDPRPAARAAALESIRRAAQRLADHGAGDPLVAQELLGACDRLVMAIDKTPVLREIVQVEAPQTDPESAPRHKSLLQSILMESETIAADSDAAPGTDPLDMAVHALPENEK